MAAGSQVRARGLGNKAVGWVAPPVLVAAAVVFVRLLAPMDTGASITTFETVIAAGNDDVEERQGGSVAPASSDLEFVLDGTKVQTVGLRFTGVAVPAGSTIVAASIQFRVDEATSEETNLTIWGEAADNAPAFTTSSFNVTSRARTTASVPWAPEAWPTVGEVGPNQRTPDLTAVVAEIVARPGWAGGNSMVFVIGGSGRRVAEAYEGVKNATRLRIEYAATAPGPPEPTTTATPTTDPTASTDPSPSTEPSVTPEPTVSTTPSPTITPTPPTGRTWNVPGDASSIQSAINMSSDGDMILVAPGTYKTNLTLPGKAITLASRFATTGDPAFVGQTIIESGGSTPPIKVTSTAGGPAPTILGLTITRGADGIKAMGPFRLLNSRITRTGDGIDLTAARGVVIRDSVFEANSDDGIDFDGASSGIVERNRIVSNGDDGIEIRLHKYSGPVLEILIKDNVFDANREDGIQLIDYADVSSRNFRIEGNLIANSAMVGLGLMADGVSKENFSGASIPEPITTVNNTFVNNPYAITGGDNMTVRNNIFAGSSNTAVKNVDGLSTVAHNLFWNNGTDAQASNVDQTTSLFADPMFDAGYRLSSGSPAIDAGVLVGRPYEGAAPDLGAYESPAA